MTTAFFRGLAGCLLAGICFAPMLSAEEARALHRSDVVFFVDRPDDYAAYGCTVVGWGGRKNAEEVHAAGVRLYSASLPFRTGFAGMIDYSPDFLDAACRNFAGEPFAVPWLWDHKHKDQPIWWGCTNSPLYREWLEKRLREIMDSGVDGLHIDDYTGTAGSLNWLSGCFCRHCMAAFREYLKAKAPGETLAELGISDLDAFDYRQFLLERGITPETYRKDYGSLPLKDAFADFQMQAVTEYVRGLQKQASEWRGRHIPLSVNSSLGSPNALMIVPYLDYVCGEVGHHAAGGAWPAHPVYIYKLAEALDRPIAAMASGQDHAYISEHNTEELLRTWIVTAYSNGQIFTAPNRLWCYTKDKGTHWYSGPREEYAWLFQFVRTRAELLDGYRTAAPVALIYDNAARRTGRGNIEPIAAKLDKANIPFDIVAAGDDWLDCRLTEEKLAPYATPIVPEMPEAMDEAQRALLEKSGRMAVFDDALMASLPRISVENGLDVAVTVRVNPENPDAPAAIHLHSRVYDKDNDAVVPQRDVAVHIPRALLPPHIAAGAAAATAYIAAPTPAEESVAVEIGEDEAVLRLPSVGLWSLVALRGQDATGQ